MSVPPTPTAAQPSTRQDFTPLVCVVDFHHARGPEVERWFGVGEGRDPATEYDWSLLPFMALSDGAHALTEDFSYFTLLRPATADAAAPAPTSLFGISCTRQIDAAQLLVRPADVTRSTVQKAVVVIADSPQYFGMLRERLSVVTKAWFAQREFTDVEILRRFQESLADEKARGLMHEDRDRDQYLGLSLRELVREFRWQTLVLLKCCLLQPKMLFFGTRCERLCLTQFSLISLIPGLLRNLQDSAGPELDSYEKTLSTPTSLKTSDRNSLLAYMGLPLQIFGKGSLFGPYTPLQQLDILADFGTKSYIVGSTNSLLLQQKDRYSDILINLDEDTVNITSPSLKAALQLSTPDRRWIDFITQNVNDTWDEANPSRPKTMGYVGSEEFIRVQFEEYLLALISSVKYHAYLGKHAHNPRMLLPEIEGDPSHDFGPDFVEAWSRTENFRIWNTHTDSHLFDIVEPKHPCAGGLTIDDIQRRITQQVQELHWDERFAQGREVLGRNLNAGREKASTFFNELYAGVEAMREAQRKRVEEARVQQQQPNQTGHHDRNGGGAGGGGGNAGVDLAKAQQTMQAVGSKAGAFVNSWAAWAGEKRKGWGKSAGNTATNSSSGDNSSTTTTTTTSSGGGWGSSWGRSSGNKHRASMASGGSSDTVSSERNEKDYARISTSPSRGRGTTDGEYPEQRLLHSRGSVSGESMLDDVGSAAGSSALSSPVASPKRVSRPPTQQKQPPSTSKVPATAVDPAVTVAAATAGGGGHDNGASVDLKSNSNGAVSAVSEKVDRDNDGLDELPIREKGGGVNEGTEEVRATPAPDVATTEAAVAQEVWER